MMAVVSFPSVLVLLSVVHHTWALNQTTWYAVNVSSSSVQDNVTKTVKAKSSLKCAVRASQDQDVHLFSFDSPDVCTMYDVIVGSEHQEAGFDPLAFWSKHPIVTVPVSSVPVTTRPVASLPVTSECRPDEVRLNENCSISVCQQNRFHLYKHSPGELAPNISFVALEANHCIYLKNDEADWNGARNTCIALGGDLFVAWDFTGVKNYLLSTALPPNEGHIWVGVRGAVWLDGRKAAAKESNLSDSDEDCGHLEVPRKQRFNFNDFGLKDKQCKSKLDLFLCQRGVTYQKP